MTYLLNILNRRILFLEQTQVPNTAGGLTQTYRQLVKCWAGCEPVGTGAAAYVRNVQVEDAPTHKFTVRRSVPGRLDFYGNGVIKSTNFVFLLSNNSPAVGRLFRILKPTNVGENDEYIEFLAKEIGELDAQRGIIK